MRVLILDVPAKSQLKRDGHTVQCKKFEVGDRKGKSSFCYVEVDFTDPEECKSADSFEKDDEILLYGAFPGKIGKLIF